MLIQLIVKRRTLSVSRRITQIAAFLIILYGVFVWPHPIETPFPRLQAGEGKMSTTKYARGRILWVSGKESVFDIIASRIREALTSAETLARAEGITMTEAAIQIAIERVYDAMRKRRFL